MINDTTFGLLKVSDLIGRIHLRSLTERRDPSSNKSSLLYLETGPPESLDFSGGRPSDVSGVETGLGSQPKSLGFGSPKRFTKFKSFVFSLQFPQARSVFVMYKHTGHCLCLSLNFRLFIRQGRRIFLRKIAIRRQEIKRVFLQTKRKTFILTQTS